MPAGGNISSGMQRRRVSFLVFNPETFEQWKIDRILLPVKVVHAFFEESTGNFLGLERMKLLSRRHNARL